MKDNLAKPKWRPRWDGDLFGIIYVEFHGEDYYNMIYYWRRKTPFVIQSGEAALVLPKNWMLA